jgi:hypothetical protein
VDCADRDAEPEAEPDAEPEAEPEETRDRMKVGVTVVLGTASLNVGIPLLSVG